MHLPSSEVPVYIWKTLQLKQIWLGALPKWLQPEQLVSRFHEEEMKENGPNLKHWKSATVWKERKIHGWKRRWRNSSKHNAGILGLGTETPRYWTLLPSAFLQCLQRQQSVVFHSSSSETLRLSPECEERIEKLTSHGSQRRYTRSFISSVRVSIVRFLPVRQQGHQPLCFPVNELTSLAYVGIRPICWLQGLTGFCFFRREDK